MILLTVRGRKTGQPRTAPVDLFEHEGQRFLVSTHGGVGANWVRNLRTVGEGSLARGHLRQAFSATELSPEVAGPLLKPALGPRLASPVRGFVLRRTLSIHADASVEDFISVARSHPVFALGPAREPGSEA
jgi:deazaflavin-dependent oxidoreductase (nitroreductase family)